MVASLDPSTFTKQLVHSMINIVCGKHAEWRFKHYESTDLFLVLTVLSDIALILLLENPYSTLLYFKTY